jgi:hypothetical protein
MPIMMTPTTLAATPTAAASDDVNPDEPAETDPPPASRLRVAEAEAAEDTAALTDLVTEGDTPPMVPDDAVPEADCVTTGDGLLDGLIDALAPLDADEDGDTAEGDAVSDILGLALGNSKLGLADGVEPTLDEKDLEGVLESDRARVPEGEGVLDGVTDKDTLDDKLLPTEGVRDGDLGVTEGVTDGVRDGVGSATQSSFASKYAVGDSHDA